MKPRRDQILALLLLPSSTAIAAVMAFKIAAAHAGTRFTTVPDASGLRLLRFDRASGK